MESKFVQTKDIKLHYLEWAGNGPPAVLLHGTGLCAQVWTPLAQALSSRFRVLALDMRGHGDSDKPQGQYQWEQVAGDLPAFLDAMELDHVLLMGHSRGGGLAVLGGAQRHERVSGIVLIEPNVVFGRWPGATATDGSRPNPAAERANKRRAVWDSREQLFRSYHSRDPFKSWHEDILRAYIQGGTMVREDGKVELKCSPEVEAQFYGDEVSQWMVDAIGQLRCPTLLITRASNHTNVTDSFAIRTLRRNASTFRHITVPNAGHFIPQEQPEAVLSATWEFVGAAVRPD